MGIKLPTPPMVRVFLSSTFADMKAEREYFSNVLAPKLEEICKSHGVSFFFIDLRWGVTEEEQLHGQAVSICLNEIDKCRPYFIGFLGNRYGSIIESLPASVFEQYPCLKKYIGKSITEVEMLYGVLESSSEKEMNCCFLFKAESLMDDVDLQEKDEESKQKLRKLKNRIYNSENIPKSEYSSMKQMEEFILMQFESWIEKEYPVDDIRHIRSEWYGNELLRGYLSVPTMESFISYYVSNNNRPLMLYGQGQRGKTTLLNAWIPENVTKVIINCASDTRYLYWPNITRDIILQITETYENVGLPEFEAYASMFFWLFSKKDQSSSDKSSQFSDNSFYFVTDAERRSWKNGFVEWLSQIRVGKPLCIIINDLNLLNDVETNLLSWIPMRLPKFVKIICTTNDSRMLSYAKQLGWNSAELPLLDFSAAENFLKQTLQYYGKKLSADQSKKLLSGCVSKYPGLLRYVISFMNSYGRFENLNNLCERIGKIDNPKDIYRLTMTWMVQTLSSSEEKLLYVLLKVLFCAYYTLNEQACYNISSSFIEVKPIEWAKVRIVLEQIGVIQGSYWKLNNNELTEYLMETGIVDDISLYHLALGNYYFNKLIQDDYSSQIEQIAQCTHLAKASIEHFLEAKAWDDLVKAIFNKKSLYYLSKLDWVIVVKAMMEVLFSTEIDIPKLIIDYTTKNFPLSKQNQKDDAVIAMHLGSLFIDLDFINRREEMEKLCIGHMRSYTHDFAYKISEETARFQDSILSLKYQQKHKLLIDRIDEFLRCNPMLNSYELCLLLRLKCEALESLRLSESLLECSRQYYYNAALGGDYVGLLEAIHSRGKAYYFMEDYSKAIEFVSNLRSMAKEYGLLREYLSASNMLGMCYYRSQKYESARELFIECERIWKKVGNAEEYASNLLNHANSYYLEKRFAEAIDISLLGYNYIQKKNSPRAKMLAGSFLGNIGKYELENKNYSNAENALLACIKLQSHITTEINCLSTLGDLYVETHQIRKAIDVYERLVKNAFDRQDYDLFKHFLQIEVDLLRRSDYVNELHKIRSKWNVRIREIFGEGVSIDNFVSSHQEDSMQINDIAEQIKLAQGMKKNDEEALLYIRLGDSHKTQNRSVAAEYYIKAAEFYNANNELEKCFNIICLALQVLIQNGRIENCDLLSKAKCMLGLEEQKQLVDYWYCEENNKKSSEPEKKRGLFSMLIKKSSTLEKNKKQQRLEEIIQDILPQISQYQKSTIQILNMFLCDRSKEILSVCSDETIEKLLLQLDKHTDTSPSYASLLDILFDEVQDDLTDLRRNYMGSVADAKIHRIEMVLRVLNSENDLNKAALAGNIALIFRRKREFERAFNYHDISMNVYRNHGKMHDCLIEMLNLATAYNEAGNENKSINILQSALLEARDNKEFALEAAIAGNIAALLPESNLDNISEKIKCFNIEESFYRKADEHRELAISLINQTSFYLKYSENETGDSIFSMNEAKQKFDEAEKIVQKYNLTDFMSTLNAIRVAFETIKDENILNHSESHHINLEKKYLMDIIEQDGKWSIISIETDGGNDSIFFYCELKDSIPMFKVYSQIQILNGPSRRLILRFFVNAVYTGHLSHSAR